MVCCGRPGSVSCSDEVMDACHGHSVVSYRNLGDLSEHKLMVWTCGTWQCLHFETGRE